jgi:hypothetical protein
MTSPIKLRAMAQFEVVVSSGAALVITDSASPPVFHSDPQGCPGVQADHFATKVLENEERNGSYFTIASLAVAQREWPQVRLCRSDACSATFGPADGPSLLEWALREGTGFDEVRVRAREPRGAEAFAPGWESTQRLALGESGGRLVLRTWPGELKAQAQAFYGGDRPARLLELTAATGDWNATPLPHLAYNNSRPQDRFYFSCPLSTDRYLSFWSQPVNLARVGGHRLTSIGPDLWPWLCENGIGDPGSADDAAELNRFVERLARRRAEAHLRPSVEVTRSWDLSLRNDPAALLREVTAAVEQVAGAVRENLAPL